MNATDLMIWGLVVHLICDWPLQNEWMASNKMKRRRPATYLKTRNVGVSTWSWREDPRFDPGSPWWDRHPAAYVHAGVHTLGMLLVFDPLAAAAIGVAHLLIDLRTPVVWWSKLVGQTQPLGATVEIDGPRERQAPGILGPQIRSAPFYDVGTEVRFWTDQVFHIAVIAIAALVVA